MQSFSPTAPLGLCRPELVQLAEIEMQPTLQLKLNNPVSRAITIALTATALALSASTVRAVDAGRPDQAAEIPTGAQMVDAFHQVFGQRHVRATHAKGIMAIGSFDPSPEAALLSKAPLFAARGIRVLVRFSDFTGIPDISDTAPPSNPRGLALKFSLPDGSTTDVVAHNFNGFPAATSGEFRELLLALAQSGADAAKPTPLDRFFDNHPAAKTFFTTQKKPSVSYASVDYFGVNAFRFTAPDGKQAAVRYRFVPVSGEEFLTDDAVAKAGNNYLSEELPTRLAKGAVDYRWQAQIAEAGDDAGNPSVAWPDSRKLIDLGTLHIVKIATGTDAVDRETLFMPTNVPDGIEPLDPMLLVRQEAYPVSFGERQ